MTNLCRKLEWDSQFFGYQIARVEIDRLDKPALAGVLKWCKEQGIQCLYFLGTPEDDVTVRLVESAGFHFVDIRLEFNWKTESIAAASASIREFREDDLAVLQQIAGQNFSNTRFNFDEHFSSNDVGELYRVWVTKSCQNESHKVFVATKDGEISGFITCQFDSDEVGRIGLIALRDDHQGKGYGRQLVQAAQRFFFLSDTREVKVVTQGRNISAQRLYQSCDFRSNKLGLWYHKWF